MRLDLVRTADKGPLVFENPTELTALRVWHCKFASLADIGKCTNLVELVIGSVPDDNIDFLSKLRKLKYLKLLHFPKVEDLSPLSELKELECLSLATTPSWDSSGKRIVVRSLLPASALPKLKHLELFRVCPKDGSLSDLEKSKSLVSVRVSGYAKGEVDRFYTATKLRDERVPESSFG